MTLLGAADALAKAARVWSRGWQGCPRVRSCLAALLRVQCMPTCAHAPLRQRLLPLLRRIGDASAVTLQARTGWAEEAEGSREQLGATLAEVQARTSGLVTRRVQPSASWLAARPWRALTECIAGAGASFGWSRCCRALASADRACDVSSHTRQWGRAHGVRKRAQPVLSPLPGVASVGYGC